ncbi:MAG: formyltransferase family protein, partial [Candidatus Bathyarchaeota archaeon]
MTRIAVFASGRGSNFQAIYRKVQEGYLNCQIDVLICDNAKAGALEFADQNKISTYVVKINEFPTPDAF